MLISTDQWELTGQILHVNGDSVTYFNGFGVEHIPNEINKNDKQ